MRLLLTPEQAGYAVEYSNEEVIRTQLEGGAGRYRADILHASRLVNVTWVLDPDEYNYLEAFYRTELRSGSLTFTIYLVIGESELVEYTARFVPKTKRLEGQDGLSYRVSAQLEVNTPYDPALAATDAALIAAFNTANGYTP